jgi:hypothetical protein
MSTECAHENKELIVKTAIGEPDKEKGMLSQQLWHCKDCRKTIRKVANGTFITAESDYTTC